MSKMENKTNEHIGKTAILTSFSEMVYANQGGWIGCIKSAILTSFSEIVTSQLNVGKIRLVLPY